jgi:hypothetical protein
MDWVVGFGCCLTETDQFRRDCRSGYDYVKKGGEWIEGNKKLLDEAWCCKCWKRHLELRLWTLTIIIHCLCSVHWHDKVLIGSDFVRIGSQPFHPKSVLSPDLSIIFPSRFFLILAYKNRQPMFPISFRLVLASHYTITFTLIVQSYSSIFLLSRANMLQSKISILLLLSAANFFQITALPFPAPYPQWVHVQWSSIINLTFSL